MTRVGCHSPGRVSPRQPGGWAKHPWNAVAAEAGSGDKARALVGNKSYATQCFRGERPLLGPTGTPRPRAWAALAGG